MNKEDGARRLKGGRRSRRASRPCEGKSNTIHLHILAEVLFGPLLEDDLALLVSPDLRELEGPRRRAPRDGAVALVFGACVWTFVNPHAIEQTRGASEI